MLSLMDPAMRHLAKAKELAKSYNVPQDLQDEINRAMRLIEARDQYCEEISEPASPDVNHIIQETMNHPWKEVHEQGKTSWRIVPFMMSGNMEAQFLKTLVSISRAKRVLELGLFTGCASLAIAEALPDDGIVYSCEVEPYIVDFARGLLDKSKHGQKVKIMKGPAIDSITKLAQEKQQLDLVFIDADKVNYSNYFKAITEKNLLAPGGTIVVDNALFFGYPYSRESTMEPSCEAAIVQFNDMVKGMADFHKVLLPLRDGVMIIRRRQEVDSE